MLDFLSQFEQFNKTLENSLNSEYANFWFDNSVHVLIKLNF